ncbi:hypothetical protein [Brevundimonas lutea]|uniref:hypothetical protein n=1 Tax=Brevundimonas lutea TaxID=2293980 RepID=UPI000F0171D9|nr:hypothetical protein [Brevundimonas lutea]
MTRLSLLAGAAVLVMAAPASAQVLGGQVGGSVGGQVATPPLGSTLNDAAGLTRDTVDRTRDAARDTVNDVQDAAPPVSAQGQANADGSIAAGSDGADADLDVQAGAMVHGSDGSMLGTVSSAARDSAGRAQGLVVQTAEGATKTIPTNGARVEGGAVITGWTQSQFNDAPES